MVKMPQRGYEGPCLTRNSEDKLLKHKDCKLQILASLDLTFCCGEKSATYRMCSMNDPLVHVFEINAVGLSNV